MGTKVVSLSRKAIYDEIWKISVTGMAKKYGLPYHELMRQIKAAKIPIPPSGYWTKLEFGKPVEMPELEGNTDELVLLHKQVVPSLVEEKLKESTVAESSKRKTANSSEEAQAQSEKQEVLEKEKETTEEVFSQPETYT